MDDAESVRTIHRALDLGVTHIDTAEIYGPFHSEEVVGRAVAGPPRRGGDRDQVRPGPPRRRRAAARCHRQQPRQRPGSRGGLAPPARGPTTSTCATSTAWTGHVPIEDTVGALAELVAEGKVRHIGLSEAGPETIRRAHAVHPVDRAADRVLAVDPRRRGRDPAAAPRARHRAGAVLPARPRPAHRPGPQRGRLPRRRLAEDEPALHRGQLRPQPRPWSTRSGPSGPRSAPPRPRPRSPGCSAAARTSPRSRGPGGCSGSRRTPPPTPSSSTADQLARLEALEPPAGDRHDEANMATVER